jgi:hypothetical protein
MYKRIFSIALKGITFAMGVNDIVSSEKKEVNHE